MCIKIAKKKERKNTCMLLFLQWKSINIHTNQPTTTIIHTVSHIVQTTQWEKQEEQAQKQARHFKLNLNLLVTSDLLCCSHTQSISYWIMCGVVGFNKNIETRFKILSFVYSTHTHTHKRARSPPSSFAIKQCMSNWCFFFFVFDNS